MAKNTKKHQENQVPNHGFSNHPFVGAKMLLVSGSMEGSFQRCIFQKSTTKLETSNCQQSSTRGLPPRVFGIANFKWGKSDQQKLRGIQGTGTPQKKNEASSSSLLVPPLKLNSEFGPPEKLHSQ